VPAVHTYIIDVVEDETGGTATFAHEDERTREGIFARGEDGYEAMKNLLARLRAVTLDDISLVSPSAPEPDEVAVPAADMIEEFRLAAGSNTEFWFSYRALDGAITQRRIRALTPAVTVVTRPGGNRARLNAFDLDRDEPRNFVISGITDVVKVA